MKNLLRVFIVVCLLAIAAGAIFLATFDADQYRPQLIAQLETALGRPVRLDRISLGWQQGVAVQLRGLAIYQGPEAAGEPLIRVESVHGILDVMPLLKKRVHVASIVLIRPHMLVARDAQGHINLTGLLAAASPPTNRIKPDGVTAIGGGASPAAASGRTAAVGGTPVTFEIGSLRIEDGTLHWTDATSQPPTELLFNALDVTVKNISPGKPLDIEARGALASETPNLRLSGRFTPPSDVSKGSCEQLKLTVEDVPLERLLPPSRPGAPELQGRLTTVLEGSAATLDPSQLAQALDGSGTLKLAEPKVANLNILREVFQRFSMLPGLVETLKARLPPEYQTKLTANDTVLAPLNVSLQIEGGALQFHELRVSTDTFQLDGAGRVGFDGAVTIRSTLRIEPVLSGALIKSVAELQSLTNDHGEMEIPVIIQGQAPQVAVLPDMHYVASKILVTKATDLLGELLRDRREQGTQSEATTEAGSPDHADRSIESLFGQVLQRALHEE